MEAVNFLEISDVKVTASIVNSERKLVGYIFRSTLNQKAFATWVDENGNLTSQVYDSQHLAEDHATKCLELQGMFEEALPINKYKVLAIQHKPTSELKPVTEEFNESV